MKWKGGDSEDEEDEEESEKEREEAKKKEEQEKREKSKVKPQVVKPPVPVFSEPPKKPESEAPWKADARRKRGDEDKDGESGREGNKSCENPEGVLVRSPARHGSRWWRRCSRSATALACPFLSKPTVAWTAV